MELGGQVQVKLRQELEDKEAQIQKLEQRIADLTVKVVETAEGTKRLTKSIARRKSIEFLVSFEGYSLRERALVEDEDEFYLYVSPKNPVNENDMVLVPKKGKDKIYIFPQAKAWQVGLGQIRFLVDLEGNSAGDRVMVRGEDGKFLYYLNNFGIQKFVFKSREGQVFEFAGQKPDIQKLELLGGGLYTYTCATLGWFYPIIEEEEDYWIIRDDQGTKTRVPKIEEGKSFRMVSPEGDQ